MKLKCRCFYKLEDDWHLIISWKHAGAKLNPKKVCISHYLPQDEEFGVMPGARKQAGDGPIVWRGHYSAMDIDWNERNLTTD